MMLRRPSTHLIRLAMAMTIAALAVTNVGTASAIPSKAPRMMFEIQGGLYSPKIDSAFEDAAPFRDTFDGKSMTVIRGHLDYQFYRGFGTLAIGFGAGYAWIDGQARNAEGETTEDEVGFNIAPLTLSLVYRWDWAAVKYGIPFVPYLKAGLSSSIWWATDARNDISVTRGPEGEARRATGITFGWHVGGGLMLLLDVFSARMAASLEDEVGIKNSYLFAEFIHNEVDDFGSSTSMVLSDTAFSFGLAFEF